MKDRIAFFGSLSGGERAAESGNGRAALPAPVCVLTKPIYWPALIRSFALCSSFSAAAAALAAALRRLSVRPSTAASLPCSANSECSHPAAQPGGAAL